MALAWNSCIQTCTLSNVNFNFKVLWKMLPPQLLFKDARRPQAIACLHLGWFEEGTLLKQSMG